MDGTAAVGMDAVGIDADGDDTPRDWRLGDGLERWTWIVPAVAVAALGLGLIGGAAAVLLLPTPVGGYVGTAVLWAAMLGVVIWAAVRGRPVRLNWFEPADMLWGLGLGIGLRVTQGWIDLATGGTGALPSYPLIGGSLPADWVVNDLVAPIVIAPAIEELFFRGVILVGLYALLRTRFGGVAAAVAASLASTGLFVLAHALAGAADAGAALSLTAVGLVCSALVVLTGRVWGAILAHTVYNATFVALALAGTLLS